MLEPKELITESILFSINWKQDEHRKQYIYLTKTKLYQCEYDEVFKSYTHFFVCLVKDFGKIHCESKMYIPAGYPDAAYSSNCVSIQGRYSGNHFAQFDFPTSEEGAKTAEKLFMAISKVME